MAELRTTLSPIYRGPFTEMMDVLHELGATNEHLTRVVRAIAQIAQLAEQRAFTPQADGSIPSLRMKLTPEDAAALVEMIRRA